jgi:hypothetical protein
MTVYCKPKTDDILLGEIADANDLLLVGCPICSNLSYGIQQKEDDSPCIKITPKGGKPIYVTKEVDRMLSLLQEKGKTVKKHVFNFPGGLCAFNDKDVKKFRPKTEGSSTIVTFSCELGKERMETVFPDKQVIGAMNAVGIFGAPINQKLNRLYLDRDKTNIKSFNLAEDGESS